MLVLSLLSGKEILGSPLSCEAIRLLLQVPLRITRYRPLQVPIQVYLLQPLATSPPLPLGGGGVWGGGGPPHLPPGGEGSTTFPPLNKVSLLRTPYEGSLIMEALLRRHY